MTQFSRRIFLTGTGAALLLAGCENAITGNGVGTNGAAKIDARVQATREYLFGRYPGTRDLEAKAKGVLYIPLVTEAGFGVGGSYGQGALLINGVTAVSYTHLDVYKRQSARCTIMVLAVGISRPDSTIEVASSTSYLPS